MIVLGFHHGDLGGLETPVGHDAGAAIVVDGELVAAVEEERFARAKHTSRFPQAAIAYCLDAAGVAIDRVERFCFAWSPALDRQNMARAAVEPSALLGRHSLRSVLHADAFTGFERAWGFAVPEPRRRYLPHHLCHAASAFFASPFDRAAYLVLDAYGEMVSVSTGVARDGRLEPLAAPFGQALLPTSLGVFYADYTQLLGFLGKEDEYKVMGLAAYGDPARFRAQLRAQWRPTAYGVEHLADGDARAAVLELARHRRRVGAPLDDIHRDLAAALQEALEDQLLHLARVVRDRTGDDQLCMAGGVALNSTANGKLARAGLFRALFVQPAASDSGVPLGAALLEAHRDAPHRPRRFSPYLGPAFDDAALDAACAGFAAEIDIVRPPDIFTEAVQRLCAQQVIGWFAGRMEYGPRALGNRSILADPRDVAIRERINRAVKHREPFRPFAPSVLAEHAAAWFELGALADSPYMLLTVPVPVERRAAIAAAVHQDGTARIQTVARDDNPRYHALLTAFHAATGVPALLNTSFNVNGEPIVCTPADAIESFLSTDLDALFLGDRVITRRALSAAMLRDLRPRIQDGVQLQTSIAAPGDAAPAWRDTVVRRRHWHAALEEEAAAVVLACDGTRTVDELVDQLAPLGDGARADTERALVALLERLLRLRILRLDGARAAPDAQGDA